MSKRILLCIRWRILLFCGIGLWVALCMNDLYYNNELILSTDEVLSTTTTTIAQEILIKKNKTVMNISHFTEQDHESSGTIRKSRILTTFVIIFISIWFILFTICIEEYIKTKSDKFIKKQNNKKELNFNSSNKTLTNTGIQVSPCPFYCTLSSFNINSIILHQESIRTRYETNDGWLNTQPHQEWFSIIKSSSDTLSYTFEEKKSEPKIISQNLEKHEKELSNNNNNAHNQQRVEYSCNEIDIFQLEHISQLIYYINLSRSLYFQSTLFTQRYNISILNIFTSLSTKHSSNSTLSVEYLYKQNGIVDDNNEKTININKLKITNFWSREKEKTRIISSSPAFQLFLANFKYFRYTTNCKPLYFSKIYQ
ncbi:PREDICTED: uncharacterized protein LOC106786175 [Polistes canadensis]|uniref:uncharacterized protein LOC106786175 n=1 Tax=Polistes canadensis TaxID=91411 RepID=UPI000718EDE3|nr:PREDICTED: uncharacterized protein LOC106786175 [Polistes canadensis]